MVTRPCIRTDGNNAQHRFAKQQHAVCLSTYPSASHTLLASSTAPTPADADVMMPELAPPIPVRLPALKLLLPDPGQEQYVGASGLLLLLPEPATRAATAAAGPGVIQVRLLGQRGMMETTSRKYSIPPSTSNRVFFNLCRRPTEWQEPLCELTCLPPTHFRHDKYAPLKCRCRLRTDKHVQQGKASSRVYLNRCRLCLPNASER
jgi:hypothetical protein